MSVRVQEADFDVSAEIAKLTAGNTSVGAIASFIGKMRGETHGKSLASMSLEHYPGMTESELSNIEAEATVRFSLSACVIVHRVGTMRPGDNIVLVVTCSSHRHDALQACDFLMDYLKTRAPFWKKETDSLGDGHWVDARTSDDDAITRWQTNKL